jgi:uncharacterized membrane protein YidH (DUF202 family)
LSETVFGRRFSPGLTGVPRTTRNLRISLTILSVGFAIEGFGEVYTHFTAGADSVHPGETVLFLLPLVLTVVGLGLVWVGRKEWNEVHQVRVRTANRVFVLSLLGGFVALGLLALLLTFPSLGTPTWARVLFGAAMGSLVFGTFVTYAYLVFHLVAVPTRAVVVGALVWAFVVSAAVAISIASDLPTVLSLATTDRLVIPAFVSPVDALLSYLFISYFLLLAAYVEAQVAVARGLVTVSREAGIPVTRHARPESEPGDPAKPN